MLSEVRPVSAFHWLYGAISPHAELLRDLGCDILQGYAFSRPLSFDDFTTEATGTGWRLAS